MTKSNYSRYIANATAAEYASNPAKRARRDFLQSRHAARIKMLDRLYRTDRELALRLSVDTPENMRELDRLMVRKRSPNQPKARAAKGGSKRGQGPNSQDAVIKREPVIQRRRTPAEQRAEIERVAREHGAELSEEGFNEMLKKVGRGASLNTRESISRK